MTTATVSAALAALETLAAAGTDPKVGPEYVQGLVRVKPDGSNRGSFIEGVDSLDATRTLLTERLEWIEVDHTELPKGSTIPVASYFRAIVPEGMIGRTGMVTFGSLSAEQRTQVRLVEGSHGPELVLPWTGDLAQTRDVWAIVGKEDGVLWTWYPGPVTPRMTATLIDDIRKVLAGAAIEVEVLATINSLAVKLQLS